MAKTKRYAAGGITITPAAGNQSNTYPFPNSGATPSTGTGVGSAMDKGMNQTFNIQPTASSGQPQQPQQRMFKKGGSVSSASKRADGCAVRGKTRA